MPPAYHAGTLWQGVSEPFQEPCHGRVSNGFRRHSRNGSSLFQSCMNGCRIYGAAIMPEGCRIGTGGCSWGCHGRGEWWGARNPAAAPSVERFRHHSGKVSGILNWLSSRLEWVPSWRQAEGDGRVPKGFHGRGMGSIVRRSGRRRRLAVFDTQRRTMNYSHDERDPIPVFR